MTVVHLRHADPGLLVIAPEGAPLVTDGAPGLDVLVLEVIGGHLTWSLLDGGMVPAAVLDDVAAAHDWVWAVYGEQVAVAVADNNPRALAASPAQPETVAALRRLAYAHWASRWWPASTVDGIAALNPRLLLEEIEVLTERCEMMFDERSSAVGPYVGREAEETSGGAAPGGGSGIRGSMPGSSGDFGISDRLGLDGDSASIGRSRGRAADYALAAGGADTADGLIVARGSLGWDWRRCPPGILDAGENAVSWQVTRAAGVSTVRVSVVAAPDCRGIIPEHLRPYAWVRSADAQPARAGHNPAAPSTYADAEFTTPLRLSGDSWTGAVRILGTPEIPPEIIVFVPGVGPADPVDESAARDRIRRFARLRLTEPTGDPRLSAETSAAESDEDF
ncbi:hypothetical protein [Nocardia sp. NPDC058480]|uniref:hypothetical protein n=1 Tax=unclassified Nocardia TaxID=2637762 RepID=UPI0036614D85